MPDEMKADQDWKDQAQAEKERLSKELDGAGEGDAQRKGLPPASFPALLGQFGLQAAMYLGDVPNPVSGEAAIDLEAARYHIDMLAVLQEKTAGNLTPEEESELKQVLTGLRMRYVSASSGPPPEKKEDEGDSKSKIVTP